MTPDETLGYPSLTSLYRSDIREGKEGTVLILTVRVLNVNRNCAGVNNADVEIWHVDSAGDYSEYNAQVGQTFLRGIQKTNVDGEVTFTTIYPGWYQDRATHIHVEVKVNGESIVITQIAFPESVSNAIYVSGVYASKGTNPVSNLSDSVFSDSLSSELATVTGSAASGYRAAARIGISI